MHLLRFTLFTVATMLIGAVSAQSELPELPREILDPVRTLSGDSIRFCYYPFGPTAKMDVAVAEAIGDALLLSVEAVPVSTAIQMPGLDVIPMTPDDVFLFLTNDCDGFMGFTLAPNAYPEWLTFSRSYVESAYVAATLRPDLDSLSELKAGSIIGTLLMSDADSRLGSLMRATPEQDRWRLFPYPTTDLLVERLLDGTVEVVAGWEPTLRPALEASGSEFRQIPLGNINVPARATGVTFLTENIYLQNAIDGAIQALIEFGELQRIIDSSGFPGKSPGQ